jgi:hypothetical protein
MKPVCALAALAFLVMFTAVNLFLPYALIVLAAAIGLAAVLGIPCGLLQRDRKGECRMGFC